MRINIQAGKLNARTDYYPIQKADQGFAQEIRKRRCNYWNRTDQYYLS